MLRLQFSPHSYGTPVIFYARTHLDYIKKQRQLVNPDLQLCSLVSPPPKIRKRCLRLGVRDAEGGNDCSSIGSDDCSLAQHKKARKTLLERLCEKCKSNFTFN